MAENDVRQEAYQQTRDDLLARQMSNSEQFDRAILTLSTAMLGLSVTFLGNVVQLHTADWLGLLVTSWSLFLAADILTVVSFRTSQRGITVQLEYAEKYYLEEKEEYFRKRNIPAEMTQWLNAGSALTFVVGMVCLIVFVSVNLYEQEVPMQEHGPITPRAEHYGPEMQGGQPVPRMRAVPQQGDRGERGQPIPAMQPLPPSQSPSNGGGSDAGGTSGGNSGDQSGQGSSGGKN